MCLKMYAHHSDLATKIGIFTLHPGRRSVNPLPSQLLRHHSTLRITNFLVTVVLVTGNERAGPASSMAHQVQGCDVVHRQEIAMLWLKPLGKSKLTPV